MVKGTKKRVLSGIRATGRLHLGNYLGAVKGMIELQDNPEYETFYMVADAHTLTTPYDVKELEKNRREVVIDYLACGLDPKKSVLFLQSMVNEHFELAFYLSSVISVARMRHLPTFKEKVKKYPKNITMALLNYPVLMAADILAYKADEVPVGSDQVPHLEVAREIAKKMNNRYGTDFPLPEMHATEGHYVPSLAHLGKMSKSVEGSYITLTDDLETVKRRLSKAPTDSGKGKFVPMDSPSSNLLHLVGLIQGKKKKKMYQEQYKTRGIKYKELKEELAEAIYKELEPIRKKRKELESKSEYVEGVIKEGAERARKIARETLEEVKEKMGLR